MAKKLKLMTFQNKERGETVPPPTPYEHDDFTDEGYMIDFDQDAPPEAVVVEREEDDPPARFINRNPESGNDTSDEEEIVFLGQGHYNFNYN